MKNYFSLLFICAVCFSFTQNDSLAPIEKKISGRLKKLLKSPEKTQIKGQGEVVLETYFWYNAMPGADNQQMNWNMDLKNTDEMPVGPPQFEPVKVYFFFTGKVIIFSYGNGVWTKTKKIYDKPLTVVFEFKEKQSGKKKFIKKKGPFAVETVH